MLHMVLHPGGARAKVGTALAILALVLAAGCGTVAGAVGKSTASSSKNSAALSRSHPSDQRSASGNASRASSLVPSSSAINRTSTARTTWAALSPLLEGKNAVTAIQSDLWFWGQKDGLVFGPGATTNIAYCASTGGIRFQPPGTNEWVTVSTSGVAAFVPTGALLTVTEPVCDSVQILAAPDPAQLASLSLEAQFGVGQAGVPTPAIGNQEFTTNNGGGSWAAASAAPEPWCEDLKSCTTFGEYPTAAQICPVSVFFPSVPIVHNQKPVGSVSDCDGIGSEIVTTQSGLVLLVNNSQGTLDLPALQELSGSKWVSISLPQSGYGTSGLTSVLQQNGGQDQLLMMSNGDLIASPGPAPGFLWALNPGAAVWCMTSGGPSGSGDQGYLQAGPLPDTFEWLSANGTPEWTSGPSATQCG